MKEAEQSDKDYPFRHPVRVYYEDTDAAGVVYYANYLKFLERARTEWLRQLGFSQRDLLREHIAFAVRSAQVEWQKPACLAELIEVQTGIAKVKRTQIFFNQRIIRIQPSLPHLDEKISSTDSVQRSNEVLLTAMVRIACIDPIKHKPKVMPLTLYQIIGAV